MSRSIQAEAPTPAQISTDTVSVAATNHRGYRRIHGVSLSEMRSRMERTLFQVRNSRATVVRRGTGVASAGSSDEAGRMTILACHIFIVVGRLASQPDVRRPADLSS